MSLSIGIAAYFAGVLCASEAAGIQQMVDVQEHKLTPGCFVVPRDNPARLMPQAIVKYNDQAGLKLVRMGTITDPVQNFWMPFPITTVISGEAKR